MKRRSVIGLFVTGLVLSILFGIASLPDEVLIESTTVENSQTVPEDIQFVLPQEEVLDFGPEPVTEQNNEKTNTELVALKKELDELKKELKQLKTGSELPEEISEVPEIKDEDLEEQSEGNVVRINLRDGVGSQER